MNEDGKWKQKVPLLLSTILLIILLYMFGWSWTRFISIVESQYRERTINYGTLLFGPSQSIPMLLVFIIGIFASFTWLLSTRVKFYQSKGMRLFTFFLMLATIWGALGVYGMAQARTRFIPYFQHRLENIIETSGFFESIVFEHTQGFYLMLTATPVLMMLFISLFLLTKYVRHDKELNERFFEFQWTGQWLQRFSKWEQKEKWPDVELGLNSATNEMVYIPGRDRTLNSIIVGSIGTGKTAALGLPMIKQDLDHMTTFINTYPDIFKREDYKSEKLSGRFMSGISIIDPSNDLCQDTLKVVKAHGIPDEAITYINPLDPDTPSINPMRGPVDKVAEVFAQVIAGLNDSKDGGNFFFEQAQRNHLKHYIYLLKLHQPEQEVTFDMLLDMYNNPQLVRKMHVMLKKTFPNDYEKFEDRDERNYWKIVQGIDEWFDLNLLQETSRHGHVERTDDGEVKYYDAKQEHVQGLRNILNDIGANPLIRRVLFGKSDFDFDRHMEVGGVLLVNTAKGELVNLARVLGKIVLMNLQNATFRRTPKVSPFHHILIDEAPDYLYNAFREFPAQSRKYKVIITTLQQTIAQMADQFGEHYMTTVIGTMRNRMVYADVPPFDANYFSEMFGEKKVYDEGQTEMAVSPLQEDPMSRSGSNYSLVREAAMTSGDIMNQAAFQCAVKIVMNNKTMPVVQLQANFLDQEDFRESKYTAEPEALNVWLRERRLYGTKAEDIIDAPLVSIEESESRNKENYMEDQKNPIDLQSDMIDQALKATVEPKPREELLFEDDVDSQEQPKFEEDGYFIQSPLKEQREKRHALEEVPAVVSDDRPSPIPQKQEIVPVIPALAGIVTSYDGDDEFMEVVAVPEETEKEEVASAEVPLFEFVESVDEKKEYIESKLDKEQEDFVKQLGQTILEATESEQ